ncbi:formate dehydrogenase accessory protein FdhE [Paracoccus gahaiensis]|uniref:Protein FdhE homolog n=1 Tax=Paracoccus gahaiensis TaxID=1706839 RepID=A0A4U0RBR1_9RHOB|nr:formate dehydrogenase accessory protein FdhE [Paracoccus gahaiensis]TJZ91940.1 formate dehydrogenase accessory protein FdhE [Paracoccus gahaiensis]
MTRFPQPDPSAIGGVPTAPLAFLPDPARLFSTRAKRLDFLAGHSANLGPWLAFLGRLSDLQARLARDLPPATPLSPDRVRLARESRMPPLDRRAEATDPQLHDILDRVLTAAAELEMPDPARMALLAVTSAPLADRHWLLENILSDTVPEDSVAPHLFAALAVQLHMARRAATLEARQLVPIRTGVCPACGGRPATSSVIGVGDLDGVRYAACACCQTQWNEVRLTCLCCGSTAAISYRSVETTEATVRAEVCGDCDSWVKILYQNKNHSLEPVADDVASLGLDLMMKDTGLRRGGVNPFLTGF